MAPNKTSVAPRGGSRLTAPAGFCLPRAPKRNPPTIAGRAALHCTPPAEHLGCMSEKLSNKAEEVRESDKRGCPEWFSSPPSSFFPPLGLMSCRTLWCSSAAAELCLFVRLFIYLLDCKSHFLFWLLGNCLTLNNFTVNILLHGDAQNGPF